MHGSLFGCESENSLMTIIKNLILSVPSGMKFTLVHICRHILRDVSISNSVITQVLTVLKHQVLANQYNSIIQLVSP